jgi:uncharacterized repeat protein (TIGR03803 family)
VAVWLKAFSITPSGAETLLYSFKGASGDGEDPAGLLNVKGMLYGTAKSGGARDDGTVFKITTSGTENCALQLQRLGRRRKPEWGPP